MAHTRGLKGGGGNTPEKSQQDKHIGFSMMELVGVFSFCCYRQFINSMAQMPSFMPQIRHLFFLRHPLHNLFSLCGNRYHNGTNICSIDEAPYTNLKKEPGKDFNSPVPRGNIRHTSRVVSLRKE